MKRRAGVCSGKQCTAMWFKRYQPCLKPRSSSAYPDETKYRFYGALAGCNQSKLAN